ncbi:MAG: hypothetical protein WCD86_13015 [Ktedonobacteraceae bacterium]
MSDYEPLDAGRFLIGAYIVQFVKSELRIALANEPEQVIVRMEREAALELTDWLAFCRRYLYQTVMRDGLETFKAQVRTEHHLPPESEDNHVIDPRQI